MSKFASYKMIVRLTIATGLMLILLLVGFSSRLAHSQNVSPVAQNLAVAASTIRPIGIALEGLNYPYPVSFLKFEVEGQSVQMGYMDVPAASESNGGTIVLLHGRNFSGNYWEQTIRALSIAGFRVIVPDQVGFGKSSKPDLPYSLDLLAMNTVRLLNALNINNVDVVGHSMGGMLAVRLARLYPTRVQKLVLEAPVGLEDYRLKVPPQTIEQLQQDESLTDTAAIERFLRNFVKTWVPNRDEPFVQIRVRLAMSAEYPRWTRVTARSRQMIYQEPICYELPVLTQPTLLVIGLEDRIALGRTYVSPKIGRTIGNFPELGRFAARIIPKATLVELSGIGHIPHHEVPEQFNRTLLNFLS